MQSIRDVVTRALRRYGLQLKHRCVGVQQFEGGGFVQDGNLVISCDVMMPVAPTYRAPVVCTLATFPCVVGEMNVESSLTNSTMRI